MADEPTDDHKKEWEELDEKTLLASILAEQQQTNQLLAQLAGEETVSEESEVMYRCTYCDSVVPEDRRQGHAEGEHNTPPGGWEDAFMRAG